MQRCCKLAAPVGSVVTRAPRARVAASHQRPGDEGKINETNREIEIPELWSCTPSSKRVPMTPRLRETEGAPLRVVRATGGNFSIFLGVVAMSGVVAFYFVSVL